MRQPLRTVRARRTTQDQGFTLIEVLAVVVIIGILVAIAVPVYMNYRKGAADKSAESDVRGAITTVEQYYTDNGNAFPATKNSNEGANLEFPAATGGVAQTVAVSAGNTIHFRNAVTYYVICGQNKDGGTIYVYSSQNGGPVKKSSQTSLTECATNGS